MLIFCVHILQTPEAVPSGARMPLTVKPLLTYSNSPGQSQSLKKCRIIGGSTSGDVTVSKDAHNFGANGCRQNCLGCYQAKCDSSACKRSNDDVDQLSANC